MSSDLSDIAGQNTDQLIQRFVAYALRLGYPWDANEKIKIQLKPGMPEHDSVVNELKAVARELRARQPVAQVRPLYESEHRSVRRFASTLLATVDPDLAQAAFRGAQYDLPTDEVVDLMRRARTPQPERPTLAELTPDALVERFVDASTRLYATRFLRCFDDPLDLEVRNDILVNVWDAAREIKARGELAKLAPLMDHANVRVRLNAAMACLGLEPQKASAILEAIGERGEEFDMMDAKNALYHWRRGDGVVWGVV
jgi:hypothetical protein